MQRLISTLLASAFTLAATCSHAVYDPLPPEAANAVRVDRYLTDFNTWGSPTPAVAGFRITPAAGWTLDNIIGVYIEAFNPFDPQWSNAHWVGFNANNGNTGSGYGGVYVPNSYGYAAYAVYLNNANWQGNFDINIGPTVPEPETWALMGIGLGAALLAARRKRHAAQAQRLALPVAA
ncbi:hypothetical protein IGB42_04221 [Andreprevotia sp. IGB-42]|uniref:PEP-CTERM sorting domain-containing protein n=1 Tax=Andreprevotia sp. IGB-42 TaxID=2497473 RepID=UPI00135B6645|nr:PEP-CTERM sorting domain-containing protein [Andreprevotia sp. IGB-42]KAF0811326.1 hypothetical protein IGB42_04221 [Andreprevotia sp. IGB-42]